MGTCLWGLFPRVSTGRVVHSLYPDIRLIKPGVAPVPKSVEPITPAIIFAVVQGNNADSFLILAVLGSIFFGIATPTEASGVVLQAL